MNGLRRPDIVILADSKESKNMQEDSGKKQASTHPVPQDSKGKKNKK